MSTEPKVHPDLTAQALKLHGAQILAYERLLADPRVLRFFGDQFWMGHLTQRVNSAVLKYYEARAKDDSPGDDVLHDMSVLALVFLAGIDRGLWKECPPPVPLALFRHPNTLNEDVLRRLTPFLRLRAAIATPEALEKLGGLTAHQQTGAVLLWLVLESGLLSSAALRRALFAFQEPILATGGFHYIELIFNSPTTGRYMMQRWLLGPMSALLCMRFHATVSRLYRRQRAGRLVSSQRVWSAIRAYLETLALEPGIAPRSLKDLLATAKAALLQCGPQLLAGYACGTLSSTSLPEDRFRAVLGFAPRGTTRLVWPDPAVNELVHGVEHHDVEHALSLLDQALAPEQTLDAVVARLDQIGESDPENVLSAASAVARWFASVLREPLSQSPARRISVQKTKLNRALPVILKVCPKLDPEGITREQASDVYAQLLHESRRSGERTSLTHTFKKWLNFLLDRAGEEHMSRSGGRPASANLYSWAEARRVLARLSGIGSESMDPELRDASGNYVLGTLLGLRSAEWMGLRTIDAQLLHEPTLSVLAYSGHRLKSAAANRLMPIGVLPPDLEAPLLQYIDKAWIDWATPRHEYLISRADGRRIVEHQLDALVRAALKRECADPTITKHHGRHSAASLLALAMMAHLIDLRAIRAELGDLGEPIDRADEIRALLAGPQAGYRDALTALSVVIGHSWLVTTCESYIHVLDICLFAALRGYAHEADVSLLRIATGLPGSTVRASRAATISDILRMAERRWPTSVHRDDRPFEPPSPEPGLELAQHLESAWHQLGAMKTGVYAENWALAGQRIAALSRVRTAKRGSTFCPHHLIETPSGAQIPAPPVNAEAARGAIRASAMLESLMDQRHPDLTWALTRFASGLQSKEARVTLGGYEEVERFAALLIAGGTAPGELLYGRGNTMAYGLPTRDPLQSDGGSYWISICSVPRDQRSERRDFTGAVWAWTMTHVLQADAWTVSGEAADQQVKSTVG